MGEGQVLAAKTRKALRACAKENRAHCAQLFLDFLCVLRVFAANNVALSFPPRTPRTPRFAYTVPSFTPRFYRRSISLFLKKASAPSPARGFFGLLLLLASLIGYRAAGLTS